MARHPLDPTTPDGYKPATGADVTDAELLPKRFEMFVAEANKSFEASKNTEAAIKTLGDNVMPLLAEIRAELATIRKEQINHATRLAYLERAKAAHGETLAQHEAKHNHHADEITAVVKRLVIVEKSVIRPPRKKRK